VVGVWSRIIELAVAEPKSSIRSVNRAFYSFLWRFGIDSCVIQQGKEDPLSLHAYDLLQISRLKHVENLQINFVSVEGDLAEMYMNPRARIENLKVNFEYSLRRGPWMKLMIPRGVRTELPFVRTIEFRGGER
jgi:hypothetical protein